MTLSQAVRAPRARRAYSRPRPSRHHASDRRSTEASWEVRSFACAIVAIVASFLLVLLYLWLATAVSAAGYDAQRLTALRDELRRQNALLEIESTRLDSPARIEAAAQRSGLVRAGTIRLLTAEALAAKR